jgi:phosphoribosylformimino-5-aminoimidazole carboxamide ribotide isomerase
MTARPFQVIPVLDLKDGRAVHAKGGRRDHYQPIQSILHPSSNPMALAQAFHAILGLATLYLADLDAITGFDRAQDLYRDLIAAGLRSWIDAGVSDGCSAAGLLTLDRREVSIVAGLETLKGPRELAEIVKLAGCEHVVFSLDLFDGKPLIAAPEVWKSADPMTLAEEAVAVGIRQILLLELSRVGTGDGLGTGELFRGIRDSHPGVRLYAGGGISRIEEVIDLKHAGAAGVLIGSALHDGRIGARELARLAVADTS